MNTLVVISRRLSRHVATGTSISTNTSSRGWAQEMHGLEDCGVNLTCLHHLFSLSLFHRLAHFLELDIKSLKISTQQPLSSESKETQIQLIRRPDQGGTLSIRFIKLLVNHFPVKFDPEKTITHYDVDVKPVATNDNRLAKKSVGKSDLLLIRDKLCSDNRFPILKTAYDGGKNIFSTVSLPTGQFKVDISDDDEEDVKRRSYVVTIKFVNELKLCKLKEYLRGELSYIPREILQAMDLITKENPSRQRICFGIEAFTRLSTIWNTTSLMELQHIEAFSKV